MELIYGVLIDRVQDGHKKYITYVEGSKTLRDSPLQQEEIDLVTDALLILKRFEGIRLCSKIAMVIVSTTATNNSYLVHTRPKLTCAH